MTTNTVHSSPQPVQKSLHRSDDRVLGGVCSGIAEYAGIDTTLVRILAVVLTLFAGGGVVLYLIAWLVMPDAHGTVIAARRGTSAPATTSEPAPAAQPTTDQPADGPAEPQE